MGKSTLIGMMARNTGADLTVLGLVGERGREVGEFLDSLGEEGRRRSVVVVSTRINLLCCAFEPLSRRQRLRNTSRHRANTFCWSWIPLRDLRWHNVKSD